MEKGRQREFFYSSLAERYPLSRKANRRFGNRKSRNTEITRRRESGDGGEGGGGAGIYRRAIDYRRGIAPLLLQTTALRSVAKRMPHRSTVDARSQTNKCWKESRLTAINMRTLGNSGGIVRRGRCLEKERKKKRYCGKDSIRGGKKRLKIENFLPAPDVARARASNSFIRNSRCPLRPPGRSSPGIIRAYKSRIAEEKSTGAARHVDHKRRGWRNMIRTRQPKIRDFQIRRGENRRKSTTSKGNIPLAPRWGRRIDGLLCGRVGRP